MAFFPRSNDWLIWGLESYLTQDEGSLCCFEG